MEVNEWYWIGYKISWLLLFVGCWIYCIANYGFLFGLGLGWLPSLIVAFVASFLWPLGVIVILGIVFLIYKS